MRKNGGEGKGVKGKVMKEQFPLWFNDEWATLEEKFEWFHHNNPHVFDELVYICRMAKAKGRKKWSIVGAVEVIRWSQLQTYSKDDFKINNNFRPLYARLIMEKCPDLEGFFDTRKMWVNG